MISILIPNYNVDITSLVNEVYQQAIECHIEFEILVLDDFSNDLKIIERNESINNLPNCIYIKNKENLGRTASRNILAKKSNYENLLFLDADVFPKKKTFIANFIKQDFKYYDVIFGGIAYSENNYQPTHALRWKFGKYKEEKTVSERRKNDYITIISGCIFIKKNIFLMANDFFENCYGSDILFTQNLKNYNCQILHISNEVYHLGLESNLVFLSKTRKAIESLNNFEQKKLISQDYSKLQKASKTLNKLKLSKLYILIFKKFESKVLNNLNTRNPSLFLFNLYKLYYLTCLKKSINA